MRQRAALAIAALFTATSAEAQSWIGQPPFSPEVHAAVASAGRGDASALAALAEAGRADAQFFAGTFLIFGVRGFPKDGPKGCAYEAAASATRSDAMHLVGECHQYGYGGEKDLEKAIAAFRKAGDMGLAKSRCAEGNVLLELGRDTARAVALCEAGARAGDEDAQTDVGNLYLAGKHVARDPVVARGWYEKAAAKGQRNAAFTLGQIFWNGDGVARDTEAAARHWKAAYAAGRRDAAMYLGDEAMQRAVRKLDGNQAALVVAGKAALDQTTLAEAIGWYEKALTALPAAMRAQVEERLKNAKLFQRPALPAPTSDNRQRSELEALAASGQADAASMRRLGEFYASGDDGPKDLKEAVRLWKAATQAGDARAPILIADRLYREIWGPQQPDATFVRVGRLPRAKSEEAIGWYKLAFERDDRPEVRDRAQISAISLAMALQNQRARRPAS